MCYFLFFTLRPYGTPHAMNIISPEVMSKHARFIIKIRIRQLKDSAKNLLWSQTIEHNGDDAKNNIGNPDCNERSDFSTNCETT